MLRENEKIIVLLRATCDPRVPGGVGRSGFGVRKRDLRHMINPADRTALRYALELKGQFGVQVVVVSYGDQGENVLKEVRSLDVDRLIFLKDFPTQGCDTMEEGKMLAGLTRKLSARLFCTGGCMADRGTAMAPAVAAALLGRSAVHGVLADEAIRFGEDSITVLRKSDRGSRQRVDVSLPCILLFEEAANPTDRVGSVDELLRSLDKEIEQRSMTDLALLKVAGRKSRYTSWEGTDRLRPRAVAITTPDPALPAFERILSLLEGGIKSRQGKLRFLDAKQTATQLFNTIRRTMEENEAQ